MKSQGETIGEHFIGDLTVELLTDGELDERSDDTWGPYDWQRLLGCAKEAVAAKASILFRGRKTCAQVMGDAMKRLRAEHREEAPRFWVPVMKLLRETAGPCLNLTVKKSVPLSTGEWEPCGDGIKRRVEDRTFYGWTVKDADGVWQKPAADGIRSAWDSVGAD